MKRGPGAQTRAYSVDLTIPQTLGCPSKEK